MGPDREIAFADLVDHTPFPDDEELAGRRVLLRTEDQFAAALALIALDGVASSILLCPPDAADAHLPDLAARALIDIVVTDGDPPASVAGLGLPVVRLGWPLVRRRQADPEPVATEWLLLTSGTTGVPKLVQHDLAALTGAIRPAAGPTPPATWATFYDIRRYGGLQIFLRGTLGDGSLVLSAPGEPVAEFMARLERAAVTHISGTPSHWRRALMSRGVDTFRPAYVRLSGEIADQSLLDGLATAFPEAQVGHAYASTEAGVGFEVTDGLEGFPAPFLGRRGDVEMKVEDGSLRIRSLRTASRYVGQEGPALADADGFIDTGDMVEIRGERCHFVGRRGGIINVGGLKVHPEEVEAIINRDGRVRMSLVRGRRSPITGAIVVADVVLAAAPHPDGEDAVRREILSACGHALPPHKVPAVLRFVPSLEVTEAGKLVRPHA